MQHGRTNTRDKEEEDMLVSSHVWSRDREEQRIGERQESRRALIKDCPGNISDEDDREQVAISLMVAPRFTLHTTE